MTSETIHLRAHRKPFYPAFLVANGHGSDYHRATDLFEKNCLEAICRTWAEGCALEKGCHMGFIVKGILQMSVSDILKQVSVRKLGELAPRPHAMCAAMAQVCLQGKDQPFHKDKCTIMLVTHTDMCIGQFDTSVMYWCHA